VTETEARNELVQAGAEKVSFDLDYDFISGVGVEVGGKRNAFAATAGAFDMRQAVNALKQWLATNVRAR
jgi:hypothetical protein